MKENLIKRMWGFTFPYIDIRLSGLAGIFAGLFLAKLWFPILSLDWYWYVIGILIASIKPVITFFKQV